MSGLQKANRLHGKWLVLLTACFIAGFIFDWWIKPKKENYRLLWNKVAEHETRLLKLEEER